MIKYLKLKEINIIENNFLYKNTFQNKNHILYSNIKYQLVLLFLFSMFLYEVEVTIHSLLFHFTLNYICSYTFVFLSNGQTIQKKTLLQYHNKPFTKAHSIKTSNMLHFMYTDQDDISTIEFLDVSRSLCSCVTLTQYDPFEIIQVEYMITK